MLDEIAYSLPSKLDGIVRSPKSLMQDTNEFIPDRIGDGKLDLAGAASNRRSQRVLYRRVTHLTSGKLDSHTWIPNEQTREIALLFGKFDW